MSERPLRHDDRLVANLLDDWERGPAARAALAAAGTIRRRRALRRTTFAVGTVTVLAVSFVMFFKARPHPTAEFDAASLAPTKANAPAPSLEIISDAELLALLHDQPVLALRDARGISSVIWLEERRTGEPEN